MGRVRVVESKWSKDYVERKSKSKYGVVRITLYDFENVVSMVYHSQTRILRLYKEHDLITAIIDVPPMCNIFTDGIYNEDIVIY